MKVGILGVGEVGSAIKELVEKKHQVVVRDLDQDEFSGQNLEILHICIPYTRKFEKIVADAIKETKPQLTIINSTVKPGTTQAIHAKTQANVVHAPMIGDHPHLFKYLGVFTKPLGASSDKAYQLAKDHFETLGVKTTQFDSPLESELAKIMSTTYYAWNILFEKWLWQVSQKNRANFDQVYTQWNQIYNQGYKSSKPNVVRPILKHQPGPIGGHCLLPNAKILDDWLSDEVTKFILSQNKKSK